MKYAFLLLLVACLALAGCGSDNVTYTAPSTSALGGAISKAQDSNAKAFTIAQKVVEHGTPAGSQDAVQLQSLLKVTQVSLRDAQDELAKVNVLNGKLAQQANQEEDAKNIAQKEVSILKEGQRVKDNRNAVFWTLAFFAGLLAASFGPHLRDTYPVLVVIPSFLAAGAAGAATFVPIGLTYTVLRLFGYL